MLELEHRFRVVDVHVQLDTVEYETTRGRAVSPEDVEREMRQAGVVRSVVSPPPRADEGGYLTANNAVARHSVGRPFVAFARLSGPRDPGTSRTARLRNIASFREEYHTEPADVEQYAYDDRFYGFVLDPLADGLPGDAVVDALADVGLPVLVRGGREFTPEMAERTILGRGFPVIVAHFGGYPLDPETTDRTIDMLDEYDRMYVDTSFVQFREPMERALLEHPDRVLFGSGAPDVHPNVGVMEVLTLDLSEDMLRRAFSKNACRVIQELSPERIY
ncbi:amidohydrolase family protein [Haloarchaeobius sp. HRN-SO-5]|uniref:amidohydrolase family protein n=1 Tax=Haloarchaeobius sp. HRN-SO-5 TaxID=3446118 RepID=UPI003EBF0556